MTDATLQNDLFAGAQRTAEGIERADARVASEFGGDELVERVTAWLVGTFPSRSTFTADAIAARLDYLHVPRDQKTRRRVVSTIFNRSRGKLWKPIGYTASHDPRRNGRPLTEWEML